MQTKYSSYFSSTFYSIGGLLIKNMNLSFFRKFLTKSYVWVSFLIYVFIAAPITRSFLEQSMLTHMLVQIPLLALCGALVTSHFADKFNLQLAYHYALPLLIIALTTTMFWMLPRNLDASLEYVSFEILKFISLPIFLGATVILGWKNSGTLTKSFVITNLISMLVVLAWLYIEAPIRLCNYYLVDEQKLVGIYLLYGTACISLYWLVKLFVGSVKNNNVNR